MSPFKVDPQKAQEEFHQALCVFSPVPREDTQALFAKCEARSFRRGEFFIRAGEVSDHVGFVAQGLFKNFAITSEGNQVILNFCPQKLFVGSLAALLTKTPSTVSAEAIEDSLVMATRYSEIEKLYESSAAWQRFGRKLAEWHYLNRELKEYEHLTLPAIDRYDSVLRRYPGIETRVSQADLAAAVGISPVSLSRILKQRRSGK